MPWDGMVNRTAEMLQLHLERFFGDVIDRGTEDQRWYWALPALLDGHLYPSTRDWLLDEKKGWLSPSVNIQHEPGERFKDHLNLLRLAMDGKFDPPLGRPPADLMQVLSLMAVAAPGVCSLRSLKRQAPTLGWSSFDLLSGAARVAEGFRTLFNLRESIALLRGNQPDTFYWQLALQHCLEGNIQALLDEQSHCLLESLGVFDEPETERVMAIGGAIGSSLTLRTAMMQIDDVLSQPESGRIDFDGYGIRCRFALRFAELKDEQGSVARAETVRDSFNSPFRPFILASTSVGQEGLDFLIPGVMRWFIGTCQAIP